MSSRQSRTVAVLMGGPSAEREVSLASGRECVAALREHGYTVVEIDAGADLAARLLDVAPDVVFNALHGRWGEDGVVVQFNGFPSNGVRRGGECDYPLRMMIMSK